MATHDKKDDERDEQVDIANDVQKGIESANKKDDHQPQENENKRATRFDGSPDPDADSEPGIFSPRDDTPWKLDKKSGPRNP